MNFLKICSAKAKVVRLCFFCFSSPILAQKGNTLPISTGEEFVISTDEGTDMNLDLSPNGQTIVFDLLGQIFTIPSKGGKANQLTEGMAWNSSPVFSPDGTTIAFLSDANGITNIWLMDYDGSNKRRLTDEQDVGFITGLEWNPDGKGLLSNRKLYYLNGTSVGLAGGLMGKLGFKDFDILCSNTYGIQCFDNYTKEEHQLTDTENYYSRPTISPDKQWLTYVNIYGFSDEDDGAVRLMLKNLKTGKVRILKSEMDRWNFYWPRFVFTRDSKKLLISFNGKIHQLDFTNGSDSIIPFDADIRVHHSKPKEFSYQLEDSLEVRYIRDVNVTPDKRSIVFSALSRIYKMNLKNGKITSLVDLDYGVHHPSLSPDGKTIAFISFVDSLKVGDVYTVNINGRRLKKISIKPGHYAHPQWSPNGSSVALFRASNPASNRPIKFSLGDLILLDVINGTETLISDQTRLDNSVSFNWDGTLLSYLKQDIGKRLLESFNIKTKNRQVLATTSNSTEQVVVSPDGNFVAYNLFNQLFVAPLLPGWTVPISLDYQIKDVPIYKLSTQLGGVDLTWSSDSQNLHWISANKVFQINVPTAIEQSKKRVPEQTGNIDFDVKNIDTLAIINLKVKKQRPEGILALVGATVITMDKDSVIDTGTILIKNNRIVKVGPKDSIVIPQKAKIINTEGKYIIPGLIDMHSHEFLPQSLTTRDWWAYREDLNFGITTTRNPSFFYNYFGYNELVDTGLMLGPRIYGAKAISSSRIHFSSYKEVLSLARTYREMGGILFKVHDKFSRRDRQWMVMAAQEVGLNITAHDNAENISLSTQTILLDGFNGMEHPFSQGKLFKDVTQLIEKSNIIMTPTLITSSRQFGNLLAAYRNDLNYAPTHSFGQFTSYSVKNHQDFKDFFLSGSRGLVNAEKYTALVKNGNQVLTGSHTGYPGIELHWEMWLFELGGMDNYQALASATINAASALGLGTDLGSISASKLADLVILDKNPLNEISNSMSIHSVMKNGCLYEPKTLKRIWPKKNE